MSKQSDDQLHARIGSDAKSELSTIADVKDASLNEVATEAVRNYIKEHRGERVEYANISRLSPYDIGATSFFAGAIFAGVLSLAGEPMVNYTLAFALIAITFWGVGQWSGEGVGLPERDRA